jgi:hypothetical protein
MAEIELHVLNAQCLNHYIADMDTIFKEVEAWQNNRNYKNSKINWQFFTTDSRIKLRRLYPSV